MKNSSNNQNQHFDLEVFKTTYELFNYYEKLINFFARRFFKTKEDREDATQELYIHLHEKFDYIISKASKAQNPSAYISGTIYHWFYHTNVKHGKRPKYTAELHESMGTTNSIENDYLKKESNAEHSNGIQKILDELKINYSDELKRMFDEMTQVEEDEVKKSKTNASYLCRRNAKLAFIKKAKEKGYITIIKKDSKGVECSFMGNTPIRIELGTMVYNLIK